MASIDEPTAQSWVGMDYKILYVDMQKWADLVFSGHDGRRLWEGLIGNDRKGLEWNGGSCEGFFAGLWGALFLRNSILHSGRSIIVHWLEKWIADG